MEAGLEYQSQGTYCSEICQSPLWFLLKVVLYKTGENLYDSC